MAATATDLAGAIAPGSTEYGDRQALEGGLSAAVPGSTGGGGGGTPPPAALPDASNPLGALLGGDVGGDNLPVTDGLSVGAGAGTADDGMGSERARWTALWQQAQSPQLKRLARAKLRHLAKQGL